MTHTWWFTAFLVVVMITPVLVSWFWHVHKGNFFVTEDSENVDRDVDTDVDRNVDNENTGPDTGGSTEDR